MKLRILSVGVVGLLAGLFIGAQPAPNRNPVGTFQFEFGRLLAMEQARVPTKGPIPIMLDTRSGQLFYFEPSTTGKVQGQWVAVEATEPRRGNDRGVTYTPAPNG